MNDRRKYPDRPYVGVGAVIVQDGKVLLVKRRYEPLAGQWSLPGGAVEVGETLEACLVREMLEETGLEVRDVGEVLLGPDAQIHTMRRKRPLPLPSCLAEIALRRSNSGTDPISRQQRSVFP